MSDVPADTLVTPRQLADRYVETMADLNPLIGTSLGNRPGADALPDYSPEGAEAVAEARRATLAALDDLRPEATTGVERPAARLLRERLTAHLAIHDSGEPLRDVNALFAPPQSVRSGFLQMPTATADDWSVIARRLHRVPDALTSYRQSLDVGRAKGLMAAQRQVAAVVGQFDDWLAADWFGGFAADGPDEVRGDLDSGARAATSGLRDLRDYLAGSYAPAAEGVADGVGRERYARWAREWNGADLDVDEAYAYGWSEHHRLLEEMRSTANIVRPGSTPRAAMDHLNAHGEAIEGEAAIRAWLQALMDSVIEAVDGVHFDIAGPVRTVEAMIAPAGTAAAGYYTRPSLDFSRPGRTWFPTLGETRFPIWNLVSMWYHEGVPGHHLQLAQWVFRQDDLSRYQVSLGSVSAATEGWALYAERLMDELGFLDDPSHRLGFLDEQLLRANRIVVDIGMHVGLPIPAGSGFHPGEQWTPELAREFLGTHSGLSAAFIDSEIVRYLGIPGQAISYKLGERAWLAGREAARAAHRAAFDLKSWHREALSLGSLGLDDLTAELAALGANGVAEGQEGRA